MSKRDHSPEPGTSAASTSRAPRGDNKENPVCPVCCDINTACPKGCRHCFCYLCVWYWSVKYSVCLRCQQPIRHIFPQYVAMHHVVQDRNKDGPPVKRARISWP
ncbi:hypothetical protein WISP_59438 [Willisornis vidua]|uniref:RING-type domain-containing protein n=1 Tax=Willisornis vidua TaxID=1566151 RepID=A0ABQ9DBN6_9PASS|nr:hypothetical protein WISP_59438 [Willisornis vidua]